MVAFSGALWGAGRQGWVRRTGVSDIGVSVGVGVVAAANAGAW